MAFPPPPRPPVKHVFWYEFGFGKALAIVHEHSPLLQDGKRLSQMLPESNLLHCDSYGLRVPPECGAVFPCAAQMLYKSMSLRDGQGHMWHAVGIGRNKKCYEQAMYLSVAVQNANENVN